MAADGYSYGTADNRLASIAEAGGHTRAFTYDASGNVTYDSRAGGGYGYGYDAAGRMATFSLNGVVQAESGLHQNWMRDDDPTTGRYIQADPLGLVDGKSAPPIRARPPRSSPW